MYCISFKRETKTIVMRRFRQSDVSGGVVAAIVRVQKPTLRRYKETWSRYINMGIPKDVL